MFFPPDPDAAQAPVGSAPAAADAGTTAPRRAGSLERRLGVGLGLSLAILVAAAWWLGHTALQRATDAYVASRLEHDAQALLGRLGRHGDAERAATHLLPVYRQPFSGHYFKLLTPTGAVRSRSLWDADLDVAPVPVGEVRLWHARGPEHQPLLVRAAGFATREGALTVAVAEDLTPLRGTFRRFELLFSLLVVAGLVAMLVVQRAILRRAFRQLAPVYRDIDALERAAKNRLTEDVPAEILPLVQKLNGLLAVYEQRLTRSRNAAGNLAHALKGPLTLLRLRLLAPADDADAAAEREASAALVERIRALVERQLRRARIAGRAQAGSLFDAAAELPALQRLLRAMHREKALDIDCRNRLAGPLPLDREDILEMLGTLVDNACKWARRRVRCTLRETDGGRGLLVLVEDDGPGCDDAELSRIARRGERLDEQVEGHGLGLAIAREIAESYGGSMALGDSEDLGGFRAEVHLPLPGAASTAGAGRRGSRRPG